RVHRRGTDQTSDGLLTARFKKKQKKNLPSVMGVSLMSCTGILPLIVAYSMHVHRRDGCDPHVRTDAPPLHMDV
ncbi:MAG: hypothetical protein KGY81_10225, partial [Phycisphaerae bacterium]|nr:hypothetical protein [Phycisphaerae bacterium]